MSHHGRASCSVACNFDHTPINSTVISGQQGVAALGEAAHSSQQLGQALARPGLLAKAATSKQHAVSRLCLRILAVAAKSAEGVDARLPHLQPAAAECLW